MIGNKTQSSYEFLSGKIRWGKFFVPSVYGKYSVELAPDEASLAIVMDLKKEGIRNHIKKDDEGVYWITLSAPATIEMKGVTKPSDPPVVIDSAGNPWNKEVGIGNGSDATIKVQVRKYKVTATGKMGIALRLTGVRIDDNVPYDLKQDWPAAAKKTADDLMEQPRPPWEE